MCYPTQKAIEVKGVDTFNMKLIIKEGKGFLVPLVSRGGNDYLEDEGPIEVEDIDINFFNLLFRLKKIRRYIQNTKRNIKLLEWKIKRTEDRKNYIMPIERI